MKSKSLIDFISKFIQMPFTPICRCFTISVPFQVDHGSFFVNHFGSKSSFESVKVVVVFSKVSENV